MVATVILLLIVVLGGSLVYVIFSNSLFINQVCLATVEYPQLFVNRNMTNPLFSSTLKNSGSVPLDQINVTVGNFTKMLNVDLEPGKSIIVGFDARDGWTDTFTSGDNVIVSYVVAHDQSTFSSAFTVVAWSVDNTPEPQAQYPLITDNFDSAATVGNRWNSSIYFDAEGLYFMGAGDMPDFVPDVVCEATSGESGGGRTGVLSLKTCRDSIQQYDVQVAGVSEIHYSVSSNVQITLDYYVDAVTAEGGFWCDYLFVVFKYSDGSYYMIRLTDNDNCGVPNYSEWRSNKGFASASTFWNTPIPPGYWGDINQYDTMVFTNCTVGTWFSCSINSADFPLGPFTCTDIYVGVGGGMDNNCGYGSITAFIDNLVIHGG
jgi:hypothetical protein